MSYFSFTDYGAWLGQQFSDGMSYVASSFNSASSAVSSFFFSERKLGDPPSYGIPSWEEAARDPDLTNATLEKDSPLWTADIELDTKEALAKKAVPSALLGGVTTVLRSTLSETTAGHKSTFFLVFSGLLSLASALRGSLTSSTAVAPSSAASVVSDGTVTFSSTFGAGYPSCGLNGAIQLSNGNYLASGFLELKPGDWNAYMVGLNPDGSATWVNSFGPAGVSDTEAGGILPTSDGGSIIVNEGGDGLVFLKLHADGSKGWSTQVPVMPNAFKSIAPFCEVEGGYLSSGGAQDSFNEDNLFQIDSTGQVVWAEKFSAGESTLFFYSVTQTLDKGYVGAGQSDSGAWITKLNSDRTLAWSQSITAEGADYYFQSVDATSDGGCVAGGGYQVGRDGPSYSFIVKLDAAGNEDWKYLCNFPAGQNIGIQSVRQTADGGFIVLAALKTSGTILFKLDPTQAVEYSKLISSEGQTAFLSNIEQTQDGGYIMSGYTQNNAIDDDDTDGASPCWILKVDSMGNLADCDFPDANVSLSLFNNVLQPYAIEVNSTTLTATPVSWPLTPQDKTANTPDATCASTPGSGGHSLSGGAIAGAVIGSVVGAGLFGFLGFKYYQRKKSSGREGDVTRTLVGGEGPLGGTPYRSMP